MKGEQLEGVKKQLIGKRVRIVGDHPYAGCSGEIISFDNTALGLTPRVKLDNPHAGAAECFVLKPQHLLPERRQQIK